MNAPLVDIEKMKSLAQWVYVSPFFYEAERWLIASDFAAFLAVLLPEPPDPVATVEMPQQWDQYEHHRFRELIAVMLIAGSTSRLDLSAFRAWCGPVGEGRRFGWVGSVFMDLSLLAKFLGPVGETEANLITYGARDPVVIRGPGWMVVVMPCLPDGENDATAPRWEAP